jgi:hypothetical protein
MCVGQEQTAMCWMDVLLVPCKKLLLRLISLRELRGCWQVWGVTLIQTRTYILVCLWYMFMLSAMDLITAQ